MEQGLYGGWQVRWGWRLRLASGNIEEIYLCDVQVSIVYDKIGSIYLQSSAYIIMKEECEGEECKGEECEGEGCEKEECEECE